MKPQTSFPNLNFIDPDARPWDSEGIKDQRARQTEPDTPSANVDFSEIMANKEAYFSKEQIRTILNYCFDIKDQVRFFLFLTLYRTGRRITEIVGKPPISSDGERCESEYKGMRPCDFRHKQRAIEFDILKKAHVRKRTAKGVIRKDDALAKMRLRKKPKRKMIAVDQELWDYLLYYIDRYKIGRMDRIFPYSPQWCNRLLHKTCEEAGVKMELGSRRYRGGDGMIRTLPRKPHCHMFRHSFAIHILESNPKDPSALPKLKNLLDHSSIEITSHYLQFSQESTREFLDKTWGVEEDEE